MKVIVLPDIFGHTPDLDILCEQLVKNYIVLNPYGNDKKQFLSESEAYEYFMTQVGIDGYARQLKLLLESLNEEVLILGFSVGASAFWSISDSSAFEKVKGSIGFYGSQIRKWTHITPLSTTILVYPDFEATFDVDGIVEQLTGINNVLIERTGYSHGFMNRLSHNFDASGCVDYLNWISSTLLMFEKDCIQKGKSR